MLKEIVQKLPEYDYLYMGDNARSPYGNRSFEAVYEFTLECVRHLVERDCRLIILACNTASAKALRTIQQKDLPLMDPDIRVLGVIRPTTESVGNITKTRSIGILGTTGTVYSNSYPVEINKFFPDIKIYQQACPLWVPLVENNEHLSEGAEYFVRKYLDQLFSQSKNIDTIILACTHYPLLEPIIRKHIPKEVNLVSQGSIVANSLADYLHRHPEVASMCSLSGNVEFLTTDDTSSFNQHASIFFGGSVSSVHLPL